MFFRRKEEKEVYKESIESKKVPQSIRRYRIIGHGMDCSMGIYNSYIAYVDEGVLVNAELTSNTEVELGVTSIVGSYIEITDYESEIDREMRICVEFQ